MCKKSTDADEAKRVLCEYVIGLNFYLYHFYLLSPQKVLINAQINTHLSSTPFGVAWNLG